MVAPRAHAQKQDLLTNSFRLYAYRRHRHWTASNTKILIIIFARAWSSGLAGWERLGQFKIRPKSNHLRVTSRLTSCILLNGLTRFNWPNWFCSSLWRNSASSYERMTCWWSNKSRFLRLKYSLVDGIKSKPERGLCYSYLFISHIYYSYWVYSHVYFWGIGLPSNTNHIYYARKIMASYF